MAEGVATNDNLDENSPSFHSQRPPEYPGSIDAEPRSPLDADPNVPDVTIRDQRLYTQPPPVAPNYTPEQMQELTEKMKKEEAKKYFSLREGQFENAVDTDCKMVINPEEDGKIISSYLLTEIDHWDHEKERIVIITEKKLVLIKYNFIGLRVDDSRKIPLISCDKIQSGRFTYPKNTMMIPRHFQTGLRIYINKNNQPTFAQNWNPWCKSMPFVTFAWHKALTLKEEVPRYMDLNAFQQELVTAITAAHNELHPGVAEDSLEFSNDPILIQVYCGASPIVHNWSIMGYNRDRGSFGF